MSYSLATTFPVLIGVEDFADLAGFTVRQVRGFMQSGDAPPSARIGKRRYFRRADVEAWIEAKFDNEPTRPSA